MTRPSVSVAPGVHEHHAAGVAIGMDADSLILQAIAPLCAGGLPQEKTLYFHEKVHPLVRSVVEFLMDQTPANPGQALLPWLAHLVGAPGELTSRLSCWATGKQVAFAEPDEQDEARRARSAKRKSTSGLVRFVTPAGTHVSEDDERMRGGVDLSRDQKLQLIQGVPIFQALAPKEFAALAKAFELKTYLEGEDAMKHGDAGQGMHIVARGQGKMLVSLEVGALSVGDTIGEAALLKGTPATETLEACGGPLTTLHLDSLSFKALGLQKRIGHMQRKKGLKLRDATVVTGVGRRASAYLHSDPAVSEDDFSSISDAVSSNTNIREVLNLTEDQIDYCAREAYKKEFKSGEIVFQKGEYGHRFYVVISGVFEVSDADVASDNMIDGKLKLRAGDSFGELALLYNAPRAATVTCRHSGNAWILSRTTFKNCKQRQLEGRMQEYALLLRSVGIFGDVEEGSFAAVCNAVEERYFIQGEVILEQGALADCLYVLLQGSCDALRDGHREAELRRGSFFGAGALVELEVLPTTILVTSERCTVLTLDRGSFEMMVQYPASVSVAESVAEPSTPKTATAAHPENKYWVPKEQLHRIGLLGTGAFGFVSLERHEASGRTYALKAMSKGHIMRDGLKNMVFNERACQMLLHSDFVVRLYGTYRDDHHLYLLLEPALGGELFELYQTHPDLLGSEEHAQFYAACAALGLEHMHSRRIIYRDLKLENCLLTLQGYLKLTDLGIAKVCLGKTYTVCGTADYFAPEMLRQTGHNRAVDWWALGVMVYMMLTGRSPFEASDTMKVYRKIIKGFAKVAFPSDFPEHCSSMVRALCQRNPEERLTMGSLGLQNYKDHPWYRGLVWKRLEAQLMPAPHAPETSEQDVLSAAARRVCEPLQLVDYVDDLEDEAGWDDPFDMRCAVAR